MLFTRPLTLSGSWEFIFVAMTTIEIGAMTDWFGWLPKSTIIQSNLKLFIWLTHAQIKRLGPMLHAQ